MGRLKQKGDLAELAVAADIVRQGFQVLFPFGEDNDFDLAFIRGDRIERVQVKYARAREGVLEVRCRSHALTNGRVRTTKHYTAATIDWIAVYDGISTRCFYVPASLLGRGRSLLHLRLAPPRNNQRVGVRFADDFERLPAVEAEPASEVPAWRR